NCHLCHKVNRLYLLIKMEPMALGSPPSSPTSPGVTPNFLPSFLMGDSQPTTPNTNISPGRSKTNAKVSFSTPTDARNLRQLLFNQSLNDSHPLQSTYNLQAERSGPPKQGLFDSIENKNVKPLVNSTMQSPIEDPGLSFNESFSRIGNESIRYHQAVSNLNNSINQSIVASNPQVTRSERGDTFWVTVFGFPPTSTSLVLAQLMNCGCIVEKKFPTQGNWVHLKYSSVHEASKALALNGKLISGNIMVGVVPYYNKQENKENLDNFGLASPLRARNLRHSVLPPQSSNTVIPQNVPQKSTGIVSKAMEYVFGW
ncbi:hypothetical protein AMK59_3466, partial [Oryctes borbonicus]